MTSTVLWNIEHAKRLLTTVEEDLKNAPEKADIVELMEACERIDRYYKNRFCVEMDAEYGEDEGTTYEDGISLEFYIEADWWHDISVVLRKLRVVKEKSDD